MDSKRSEPHSSKVDDPQKLIQRLWELEDDFPQALRESCLEAGDALVPGLIHWLESMLDADALGWPSIYAVELLGTIGDSQAARTLLRCLAHSDELEFLHQEVAEALVKLGTPAMGSILEAYAASSNGALQDEIACVLQRLEIRDERVYEILLETLERTPELGANCLAEYGDHRADLGVTF